MQLRDQRIILTGASSGIGCELARALAARGARLVLVSRRELELEKVKQEVVKAGGQAITVTADITHAEGRAMIVSQTNQHYGGSDVLINNAGISDFAAFSESAPVMIERIYMTNVIAPVLLSQAVLPQMLAQGQGRIVNMGSIFGSIGFAYFAAYSSSKFALRGFSEALRRELTGSGVAVTYVAPRAVKTAINSAAVYRMAEVVKMKMDDPETIANWIVRAIEKDKQDAYYGLAESVFAKLNGLLPRLVDKGTDKQNRVMRDYAESAK